MKTLLKHFWLIVIFGLPAVAAPLPANVKLGIIQGVGSAPNLSCSSGSCFGMEVAPGFVVWTDIGSGTDGGIIVGKNQASGGQELAPSSGNTTPGQLTAAWLFFGNYGTFFTAPGGDTNVFDDAGCAGATCIGKTVLNVFNVAWNGGIFPMGSAAGCSHVSCSPDQLSGIFIKNYTMDLSLYGSWSINYSQVVPSGPFLGVKFGLVVRGPSSVIVDPCIPKVGNINLVATTGSVSNWIPAIICPDESGNPPTCRIGTPPLNGTATVASNCSTGTYMSNAGFFGIDSFTYIVNMGNLDSPPGTVTVAVGDGHPTPTFTPTVTSSGTPAPTPSPLCTPNPAPYLPFLSTAPGQPVSWDVSQSASNCTIAQPPVYGVVTLTGNCAGVYTPNIGFIGRDQFTYAGLATAGSCPANFTSTITIDVCPVGGCAAPTPTPRPCEADHPVTHLSSLGKQGTLSITLTGNIVSVTNKEIKICPGTLLSYSVSSSRDAVKCKIKNILTSGSGTLRIRDHLKCTDKPGGKDKLNFKVKSGVAK